MIINPENYDHETWGVEQECFAMYIDDPERPATHLRDLPITWWIRRQIEENHPTLKDLVTYEQATPHVEIRTDVHDGLESAATQTVETMETVNGLLDPHGIVLVCQPLITDRHYIPTPASLDPEERACQLFKLWTEQGIVQHSVMASTQINLGNVLTTRTDLKERLRECMHVTNWFTNHFNDITAGNSLEPDFTGHQGRLEKYKDLIVPSKRAQFPYEWPDEQIILPTFKTLEEYELWMACHSGVRTIDDPKFKAKDTHPFTTKMKPPKDLSLNEPWILESRYDDATGGSDLAKVKAEIIRKGNTFRAHIRNALQYSHRMEAAPVVRLAI